MPRTLTNENDRTELLARLRRLEPDAAPQWGTLSAHRMLCHISDVLRVALGQISSKPLHNAITRSIGKFVVVNTSVQAPKGKITTAPEMMSTRPADWAQDLKTCEELVLRVAAGEATAVHPAFGPLTAEEWGRMCWKHTEHHLRQFGV